MLWPSEGISSALKINSIQKDGNLLKKYCKKHQGHGFLKKKTYDTKELP